MRGGARSTKTGRREGSHTRRRLLFGPTSPTTSGKPNWIITWIIIAVIVYRAVGVRVFMTEKKKRGSCCVSIVSAIFKCAGMARNFERIFKPRNVFDAKYFIRRDSPTAIRFEIKRRAARLTRTGLCARNRYRLCTPNLSANLRCWKINSLRATQIRYYFILLAQYLCFFFFIFNRSW